MNLPSMLVSVFLAGLFSGAISCSLVQGGLLTATVAGQSKTKPILGYFILGKIIAYALFGLLLGWFGAFFSLSITTRILLNIVALGFMTFSIYRLWRPGVLLHLGYVRPLALKPKGPMSKGLILGTLTVLLPCGVTQWAMALAVTSANPWAGLLIMLAFTLGTLPIFFALGLTTQLLRLTAGRFGRLATSSLIAVFALATLNNTIALTGAPYVPSALLNQAYCRFMPCSPIQAVYASDNSASPLPDIRSQEITIAISSQGYAPEHIVVASHANLSIHLQNIDSTNCAQDFTIPSLGIEKLVPPGHTDTISLTTPAMSTQIAFMCSVGNYRGVIYVN